MRKCHATRFLILLFPPAFSHLPSSLTWKILPSQSPGRAPVNKDSGNERRQHSGRREGTRMGGRHICVCLLCDLTGGLRRSWAEQAGSQNERWWGRWWRLGWTAPCPAGRYAPSSVSRGKKKPVQWVMTRYKHIHTATRQQSFKHLQPICGITNNPRHKGRLSQKCNERLHGLVPCGTTMNEQTSDTLISEETDKRHVLRCLPNHS